MDFNTYRELATKASDLHGAGKSTEALKILAELVLSDISDIDKSVMCLNAAIINDQAGEIEQALKWYDRGMAYEQAQAKYFVTMRKAAYLVEKKRLDESLQIFQRLLSRPYVPESDKIVIQTNINLVQKMMKEQKQP
jgi:Tfp pilus assembly protein PilF